MSNVEIIYRYGASEARPRPANAEEARGRLDDGSRTIHALLEAAAAGDGVVQQVVDVDRRDIGIATGQSAAPRQQPYAAVLGCSDARVPIELIFNEGPNDLFVVRVAGNGLGAEGLGSLKYAAEHLGDSLKLVVVLGHSGCGAVSAAVDVFLNAQSYLALAGNHALRSILDRLQVVVQVSAKRITLLHGPDIARHAGYRSALVESAVVLNAALAAYTLQHELRTTGASALRAAYGVWLLESREVWAPRYASPGCQGLAFAPDDAAGIGGFVDAVVRSDRIAGLLGSGTS